jgi:molybdenum cofactor cytidylyltransferase
MIAALVPAAGRSTRMGRNKLLLELGGERVLARVVAALRGGGASRIVVVAPPVSASDGPAVAALARDCGAEVVIPPEQPPEMRDSIELGLAALANPAPPDRVLIAPADSPGITAELVSRLLAEAALKPQSILAPGVNGHRGHPLVLPWDIAQTVTSLASGLGLSELVARHGAATIELSSSELCSDEDLDTPDDFKRWQERLSQPTDLPPSSAVEAMFPVRVLLFASARERAGQSEIELDLPAEATVAVLRSRLQEAWPTLEVLVCTAMIAVDQEYATDETVIRPGAQIAIIPPVSGGAKYETLRPLSLWERMAEGQVRASAGTLCPTGGVGRASRGGQ